MFITFLVLPFYWIRSQFLRRFGNPDKIHKEMKMYPKHYFGFRRIKVIPHGFKPDQDGTYIFVCNHQSHNDIFVTLSAIDLPFRFVAKKELFENIVTGTFMKMSNSYPLDREDPRKSLTILKEAVEDTNQGHSILAFPEGTRSYQKDMLEFKDGIFSMLRRAKVPVVVMYIKESFDEKQKNMNVFFADPILPETYNKLKGTAFSQLTYDTMNTLKNKVYASTNNQDL